MHPHIAYIKYESHWHSLSINLLLTLYLVTCLYHLFHFLSFVLFHFFSVSFFLKIFLSLSLSFFLSHC